MILKPEDMEAVTRNFQDNIFMGVQDHFREWVKENICDKLKALGLSDYFYREGCYFPEFRGYDVGASCIPEEYCNIFDAKYDELRQMRDVEGNYYDAMLRDCIRLSAHQADMQKLLPEETFKYLWQMPSSNAASQITEIVLADFNQRNQVALAYLKKRLTFYAMGLYPSLIK